MSAQALGSAWALSGVGPEGSQEAYGPRPRHARLSQGPLLPRVSSHFPTPQGLSLANESCPLRTWLPSGALGPLPLPPSKPGIPGPDYGPAGAVPGSEAHIRARSLARRIGFRPFDASVSLRAARVPVRGICAPGPRGRAGVALSPVLKGLSPGAGRSGQSLGPARGKI